MTPTLMGRWQTRTVMFATLGLLVTLVFVLLYRTPVFLYVLGYIYVFGLIWDIIYIGLQRFRWDRDWPAAFQVLNGFTEGALVYLLIWFVGLPGIPQASVNLLAFILHYGLVWLLIFLWVQGPMRTIFPFWRFHGGQIWPRVPNAPDR